MQVAIEKQTKLQKFRKNAKRNAFLFWTLLPAFLYIVAFFIVIAFFLFKLSLTTYSGGMVESNLTVENYANLIKSEEFRLAFRRTIIFVLITTPLQLFTGLITAILINRKFRGRGLIRSFLLLPMAIPTIVTTSIILLTFSRGGHVTSLLIGQYSWFPQIVSYEIAFFNKEVLALGLAILGKVWRDTPISMLILLAGLQSINEDQYEAAKTMGANNIHSFFYITLPLLTPAISSVLVLRSIEAWKEFIFPYVLAPSFPIMGVLIEKYYIQLRNPGVSAALGIILIVVILIGTVALQWLLDKTRKYLVKV